MKQILKKVLKWVGYVVSLPIIYLFVSLILTFITIPRKGALPEINKSIFLSTNGVHLDIVIPKHFVPDALKRGLVHIDNADYIAFGWGNENFYLNTPTWGDLTFKNAVNALFLKSTTLVHVTRYTTKQNDWMEVGITDTELKTLINYLTNTFKLDANGKKIWLSNKGYFSNDDFYKANGSYSCVKTCNSWVNTAFKRSGMKACLWTPFDFGLLNKYK